MIHEKTSRNDLLAEIQKLQCDRAYRDASQSFYIEGVRNFIWAIDNHLKISQILYSEKLLTAPIARKQVRQARRSGVPCLPLTPEQFRQMSRAERASGIAAIAIQPWSRLAEISPQSGLCWVVLETVRSPGNLGTLIRTSEAFGGAGFILIGNRIDPFALDVVRASMGAVFRQVFVRTNLSTLQAWGERHQCAVIGASPDGTMDMHQLQYPHPTLLFLGEERRGLTQAQRQFCQQLVRIPMVGTADSLNLAIAGSLMMYEMYRSRLVV
ncbi:TrmH family RNA methyltransferase [Pseudanabaena sp. PCC 6802]|uniref:TrmH family RNA methyltransferase n=1 Tax=Pseudanabaena sp. PCC 6802 TaxID=118173 RepID=UPI00034C7024|nr:RNA methyltransferase [Pseudanabaena sp. PCC 6802]